MSINRLGKKKPPVKEETKIKLSLVNKGRKHSAESINNMVSSRIGQVWWNNGIEETRLKEQPPNWIRGRLKSHISHTKNQL
jgi:hypothetical protein